MWTEYFFFFLKKRSITIKYLQALSVQEYHDQNSHSSVVSERWKQLMRFMDTRDSHLPHDRHSKKPGVSQHHIRKKDIKDKKRLEIYTLNKEY